MKTNTSSITLAITLCLSSAVLAQSGGNLTPPAGAPAKTMKSLNQVEPRTPLVDGAPGVTEEANGGFTISQPGSYYLSGNLTVANGNGIKITTSNVSLDFRGFTVSGTDGYGIIATSASELRNIRIHNGSITGFRHGMNIEDASNSHFENLHCSGSQLYGIFLDASNSGHCNNNRISRCSVTQTGSTGIYFYGFSGECNGNTISHCSVSHTGGYGIYLQGQSGECNGNNVHDNTLSNITSSGIHVYIASSSRIVRNQISAVKGEPLHFGIYVYRSTACRIEANHIGDPAGNASSTGIRMTSTSGCLVVKNTCVGHDTNFSFNANDLNGPQVSTTGTLANAGNPAHPWANFSINLAP